MKRRDFCLSMGSALALSASPLVLPQAIGIEPFGMPSDVDPCGGYNLTPPKRFLFTDLRHIDPGDLTWRGPDDKVIPVAGPPEPPVTATANLESVPRGIRLAVQKAQKEGPVSGLPSEVVQDGDVYRAWKLKTIYPQGQDLGSYSVAKPLGAQLICLESTDGYNWIARGEGSRIDIESMTGVEDITVFIDPAGKPEERYKGVFNAMVTADPQKLWALYQKVHPRNRDVRLGPERMFCIFGVVSPDGLNWTRIREPLLIHMGDTDNGVYYDRWLGKYVLYTRLYWLRRRLIARAESDDFRHWTPLSPLIWSNLNDPFYFDVYTNARTHYPGLPEYHLMFPEFYNRYEQTSEIRMYSSLDGICWNPVPGGPVLQHGDPGAWDGEYIVARRNLVPIKNRVAIPYQGFDHPHKFPRWQGVLKGTMGWASWPEGRICALQADQEGEFTTFPLQVTGRELRINARVRRAGEIRVGFHGIAGHAASECDPVVGDVTARTVTWKGNPALGVNEGNQLRMHFKMRSAELFGFEWA